MNLNKDITELFKYFKKKKITIDKNNFIVEIKSHPRYQELISIIDTLESFDIEYDVYKANLEETNKEYNIYMSLLKSKKGKY